MVYRDKNTGLYYMLNNSPSYWWDCYSFNESKEQEDGFIPFCTDCREGMTEEEIAAEDEVIRKFEEEWSTEQTINYCLEQMGTSLKDCELLEDDEEGELHEELNELIQEQI